uniref:Uncharacterized protein n=1 Tax=Candidatus Kentrum sp. DK TaxID=2126562 RepID=A0A450RVB4_9GAMM|nr:MAG: hypothetical protein BECKDK2373B_GA0170837_100453 [Candidatus Kentron sp. DK]
MKASRARGPVYKPGSVREPAESGGPGAAIHLGRTSPCASSDLPGDGAGRAQATRKGVANSPYLVLLQAGFTLPPRLPGARCALTAPFHPYPLPAFPYIIESQERAVYFLWHFPWTYIPQALPGALPCGARTFLPTGAEPRHLRARSVRYSGCPTGPRTGKSTPIQGEGDIIGNGMQGNRSISWLALSTTFRISG